MSEKRKLRVGVIFGGRSGEHEVSLMSAMSVLNNLDPDRYEVVPIGITKQGRWVITGDPMRALKEGLGADVPKRLVALIGDPAIETKLVDVGGPTTDTGAGRGSHTETTTAVAPAEPGAATEPAGSGPLPPLDVVFPVLHGPYGEDGTIQGLLDLAGLPYVGAGVLASAAGMDKGVMKDLFVRHGLPVLDYLVFLRKEWRSRPQDVIDRITAALPFPVFVKPCNLGSSVGTFVAFGWLKDLI